MNQIPSSSWPISQYMCSAILWTAEYMQHRNIFLDFDIKWILQLSNSLSLGHEIRFIYELNSIEFRSTVLEIELANVIHKKNKYFFLKME